MPDDDGTLSQWDDEVPVSDRVLQFVRSLQLDDVPDDEFIISANGQIVRIPPVKATTTTISSRSRTLDSSWVAPTVQTNACLYGLSLVGAAILGAAMQRIWATRSSTATAAAAAAAAGKRHTKPTAKVALDSNQAVADTDSKDKASTSSTIYAAGAKPTTQAVLEPSASVAIEHPIVDSPNAKDDDIPDLDDEPQVAAPEQSVVSRERMSGGSAVVSMDARGVVSADDTPMFPPIAVAVTTMEVAEDAIHKMTMLEQACAKAGRTIDPNISLQWAMNRQNVELQIQHSCAQEWRQYHYDHGQRTVDREIRHEQHSETVKVAREDKDWLVKLRRVYDKLVTVLYSSFFYCMVGVLALDMLGRFLGFYHVWSSLSFRDLMCYGALETKQSDWTWSFSRVDRWASSSWYSYYPPTAAATCNKIAAVRFLTIGAFYLLLWFGTWVLRNCSISNGILQVLTIFVHMVALSLNGWLPTTMMLSVAALITAIYSVGYAVVCRNYRLVRDELQALKDTPSVSVVTDRMVWFDDAIYVCQVSPLVVGSLWGMALYLLF